MTLEAGVVLLAIAVVAGLATDHLATRWARRADAITAAVGDLIAASTEARLTSSRPTAFVHTERVTSRLLSTHARVRLTCPSTVIEVADNLTSRARALLDPSPGQAVVTAAQVEETEHLLIARTRHVARLGQVRK